MTSWADGAVKLSLYSGQTPEQQKHKRKDTFVSGQVTQVVVPLQVHEPLSGGTQEYLPLYFNIMVVLGETFSEVLLGVKRLRTTDQIDTVRVKDNSFTVWNLSFLL